MMKEIQYRDVITEKIKRQNNISEMEYHVNGDCIHIGKISHGCKSCFMTNKEEKTFNITLGTKCQEDCSYCYYNGMSDKFRKEYESMNGVENDIVNLFNLSLDVNYKPEIISFCSIGEPLLYLNDYKKFNDIIKVIEKRHNYIPYKFIYTNGLLIDKSIDLLKEMDIREIRFHPSASNFSEKVINNMRLAKEAGFIVTVEEPAYPPNKEKLINLLPLFDEIGIKHLDMIEVQVTSFNHDAIASEYPNGLIYKDALHQLYDDGMVYDIIELVLKEKYNFSVLDCNSGVEKYRHYKSNFYEEGNDIDEAIST